MSRPGRLGVSITTRPPSSTSDSTATFAWSVTGTNVRTTCALDGGDFATCSAPKTYSGLQPGPHSFVVRASSKSASATDTANWTVTAPTAPSDVPADPTSGSTLLWSDEFAGPAGSPPDPASWNVASGVNYNSGDDHVAYTRRPENVSQDGQGNLALTVQQETYTIDGITRGYTSGRINSGGRREFAPPVRIEARIRIPTEQGLVPAFWTLGSDFGPWGSGPVTWPDCGEIDMLEATNHNPARALYTLHGPSAGAPLDQSANRDVSINGGFTDGADLDTAYHVYGMDLYPDRVDFRFDGVSRLTLTRSQYEAAGGQWAGVYDRAQYLILNIGALYSWVGDPTFSGSRSMLIDWVRASRL